ncbi:sensor histidine kinase [Actinophytocola oryzae]|uniref:histidine kinase n=1 Tax=Actinophytocola oryzae TaxID=502181 RepID=A0A4R7W6A8_9PSEU|nr:sensor histidine kinase [Actinophytocola oryzae]TDV57688.1 histidine kinase [Actinophytocola oryzae]
MLSPARAIPVIGVALAALDAWLATHYGTYGFLFDLKEISQILAWLVAGLLAARLGAPMGVLMMALGLLLACTAPAAFALDTDSYPLRVVVAAAFALTAFQLPLGAHVFLAYPSGAVRDRPGRALMVGGYVFGAVTFTLQVVFGPQRHAGRCRDVCEPLPLVDAQDLATATTRLSGFGSVVLAFVGVVVIARRMATSTRRQRRVLAFPAVAMVATAGLFAAVGLLSVVLPDEVNRTLTLAQFAALVAVPTAFFWGLVRARLDEARVSDLVRQIQYAPASGLRDAVATALDDPGMRLVLLPSDGMLPGDPASRTVVGDPDEPLAVIVHDPALSNEPALMAAVSAAVGLALENARLQEALRAQLEQVRASRARLVTAGDDARRRLERDLHDGAQQRLLSVGLILTMLRRSLPDAGEEAVELLDEMETELRAATSELRELARGIHPAVLTMQGLRAAVEQVLVRVPLRVHANIGELPRLPQAVEATVYFVVSEAVTNTMRHAEATEIRVDLDVSCGQLLVRVADDGTGGAAPGSGISGLVDRVAAVGGKLTMDSPEGAGTTLTAELPCD